MAESLTELRDAEEEALGNLLAWMLPGEDRDRMKEDIRAYREVIERRVSVSTAAGPISVFDTTHQRANAMPALDESPPPAGAP